MNLKNKDSQAIYEAYAGHQPAVWDTWVNKFKELTSIEEKTALVKDKINEKNSNYSWLVKNLMQFEQVTGMEVLEIAKTLETK